MYEEKCLLGGRYRLEKVLEKADRERYTWPLT